MTTRYKIIIIVALVVVLVFVGTFVLWKTGIRSIGRFVGSPTSNNSLPFVEVSYEAFADSLFGGSGAKGFRLCITN